MIFEAEVYIYVYKSDDNFATSDATLLSDLDLQETYRAIDSVATGRIPSLFCVLGMFRGNNVLNWLKCFLSKAFFCYQCILRVEY